MLNIIWLAMMLIAVIVGAITGKIPEVILSVTESAKFAFTLALGLTGVMALWLGIMKIAEKSGLLAIVTRLLQPLLRKIFPDIPKDDPVLGAMAMNFSALMLGLTNAATPLGIRAMEELEKLNNTPGVATNTMCRFVALHSSNLQLIPTTAIALLAASGATNPSDIIVPLLLSGFCSVIAAIIFSKLFERSPKAVLIPESRGEVL